MANLCYIIIGPSGAGKTSLAASCFEAKQKIISHTTRPPRVGEKNGIDYYFVSHTIFKSMAAKNEFAEYDVYADNYYGVSKVELEEKLTAGDCFDVLTLSGFLNLYKQYGEIIIPVLLKISEGTVTARLQQRGENMENIQQRLDNYHREVRSYHKLQSFNKLITIQADKSLNQMIQEFKDKQKHLERGS